MATAKQIEANRANAQKSTGPNTKAGKERSRQNALKHGLTAEMFIIAGECACDFNDFRVALMERFDPQCAMEAELVERITGTLWRLRRVPIFETAVLTAREIQCIELGRLTEVDEDESGDEELVGARLVAFGESLIHDSQFGETIRKLARHETTLMNALEKTFRMLTELQGARGNDTLSALRAA